MICCPDPRKRGSGLFFCNKGNEGRGAASAPTKGLPIGFRRGRCPHRPASVTRGPRGRGVRIATASVRTGFAMTWFFMGCGARPGGGVGAPRPTKENGKLGKRVVGDADPYAPYETSIGWDNVGGELSAASGRSSELISRKCPDWRPQQWPGIGWHDGGQPPAPTGGLQEVCGAGDREGRPYGGGARGAGRAESPSHGFAVPAPLGKGAEEDGRKQRVFDAIKPPPGAGALKGVCGEGGLR